MRLTAEDSDRGDVDIVLDFVAREVREYADEKVRYRFRTRRAYIEKADPRARDRTGIQFPVPVLPVLRAAHRATYNEFVYVFFKCLSEERLNYAEGWFAEQNVVEAAETVVLDGWEVQRRCPHLKARTSPGSASIEDGVLTCQMHGWKWRLADGKCLTSVGHDIRSAPAGATR